MKENQEKEEKSTTQPPKILITPDKAVITGDTRSVASLLLIMCSRNENFEKVIQAVAKATRTKDYKKMTENRKTRKK